MEYSGSTPQVDQSSRVGQSREYRAGVGPQEGQQFWVVGQPAAAAWLLSRWWGAGFWSPVVGAQPARCGYGGSSPILAAARLPAVLTHLPVVTLRLAVPISQAFTLAAKRSEHRLSCRQ